MSTFQAHATNILDAVHLYTPPRDESLPVPTWLQLDGAPFTAETLRDLHLRRMLGPSGSEEINQDRLLRADIAFLAKGYSRRGDALYSINFLYDEAERLFTLPIDEPGFLPGFSLSREAFIKAVEDSIQDLAALWDRLTNGMSVCNFIRGDVQFWDEAGPAGPLKGLTFASLRFINATPHSLHLPLRAAIDMLGQVFGPTVAKSFLQARKHMASRTRSPISVINSHCAHIPHDTNDGYTNLLALPTPAASAWRFTHISSMKSYPHLFLDVPFESDFPTLEAALLQAGLLQQQNDLLHAEAARLRATRPTLSSLMLPSEDLEAEVRYLKGQVDNLQAAKADLMLLVEELLVLMSAPTGDSETERLARVEKITEEFSTRSRWFVTRARYDEVVQENRRASRRLREMQAMLISANRAGDRARGKEQRWARRFQLLEEFTNPLEPDVDCEPAPHFALLHEAEMCTAIGPRVNGLIDTRNEMGNGEYAYMKHVIYNQVSSMPVRCWSTGLQEAFRDEHIRLVPDVLLALATDLMANEIGGFPSAPEL
ncbi:hypothetical protein FISHEDRAFT_79117 [Fistulina hepatica ATCC 64428]|uniref:Uncharacterized protein n=1 Tax=Fistulina hepatica ATCC 64428 TaxID=1128425 RepID=A0A0D6ZZ27_9AGAR|nr:hypothetical protein FISHEDRAFT_79117 [Fistulina hepatica ATCC 64428]